MTAIPSHRQTDIRVFVEGELTAVHGGTETKIIGTGNRLSWDLLDGSVLGAFPVNGRDGLAAVSRGLASHGLTLEMRDHTGVVVEMGDVERSTLGRLVFGTAEVRLRRPLRLARLFLQYRRSSRHLLETPAGRS